MITKLTNLINPEVMADMISAKLPALIRFSNLAEIDTTLEGQPGDTITVPKYNYIGDAVDRVEGEAIESVVLTTSSTTATVKEIGQDVDITDKALNSGYGDPLGNAEAQLGLALAAKIDSDCLAALGAAVMVHDASDAIISYDGVVDGVDKLQEEEEEPKVIFVHPSQVSQLRKDKDFVRPTELGDKIIMSGVIGEIAGCQIVKSTKIVHDEIAGTYTNYIVKAGAVKIYSKAKAMVEAQRNAKTKTTLLSANQYYTAVLENPNKVVKVVFADVVAEPVA